MSRINGRLPSATNKLAYLDSTLTGEEQGQILEALGGTSNVGGTTAYANKIVKTNESGLIDSSLIPETNSFSNAIVTTGSPIAGSTILGVPFVDETYYAILESPGLPSLIWSLPSATNSRVGQIKIFVSSQNITTFIVTVAGGGNRVGITPLQAYAHEAYSYQCISTEGTSLWLRLS